MFNGMTEDPVTQEEIWKYKHLVETVAIYRIRPEWFDQKGDTRGEGTLLAKSKD